MLHLIQLSVYRIIHHGIVLELSEDMLFTRWDIDVDEYEGKKAYT